MTTPPPLSMEAQFERIHGEMAMINVKLDHEAEWRSSELTGLKAIIEDLRNVILSVKEHADKVGNVVRSDLERQVHDTKVDLAEHEAAAHPHNLQEEWIRSTCHELTLRVDRIDSPNPDTPGRVTRLEQRAATQAGMMKVLGIGGGLIGSVCVYVVVAAINHGVWG